MKKQYTQIQGENRLRSPTSLQNYFILLFIMCGKSVLQKNSFQC